MDHHGSRRNLLLLLDSPNFPSVLNAALAGTDTVVAADAPRRPLGSHDDREYELPAFCREYPNGRIDVRSIDAPEWWIVKRAGYVRTPTFDLIADASISGAPGLLLVEAKSHHGELETCGKAFGAASNPDNHRKIAESIDLANRSLNAIAPGFRLSRDAYYQISNRVAWGWRLAALGLPVTLLYLGFLNDSYWSSDAFESPADWTSAARRYLGNVIPLEVLGRALPCSAAGSLRILETSLPGV